MRLAGGCSTAREGTSPATISPPAQARRPPSTPQPRPRALVLTGEELQQRAAWDADATRRGDGGGSRRRQHASIGEGIQKHGLGSGGGKSAAKKCQQHRTASSRLARMDRGGVRKEEEWTTQIERNEAEGGEAASERATYL